MPEDRSITHHLYGGDWENRLKQELLLGCGGIQALRKLGIEASTYHCNEGHAAFTGLERLKEYITEERLTFAEAIEVVRASSLFTTHTPVPAGHDAFSENMLRTYISHYADRLKISWEQLLGLGKINVADPNEKFSMSFLAANLAQEMNGVSWLHGEVSKEIFKGMWPGYMAEELHISYVTNGVHYPTWAAPEWKKIEESLFGEDFKNHHYDKKCFEQIYTVPDAVVYEVRTKLRKRLIDHVKELLKDEVAASYFTPRQVIQIRETLRDDILTIGFARRFATYKRAHLLFRNLERLDEIVNNPKHPVQFIFAGKAHPADKAGQDLIKRIVEVSKYPQFLGKIIFLENYDMQLARRLVSGVDIWLNTPTRPLEASGTSGEKALMNGVVNFSVLDGWWLEGYREGAGWALTEKRTYQNQEHQDQLDAATIYSILETEILPLYYARNKKGYSEGWIKVVKNSIAQIAPHYTMKRQLDDYYNKFYNKLAKRFHMLSANDNAKAKEIAAWKEEVVAKWDSIEIVSCDKLEDLKAGDIESGKEYTITYVIDEKGLNDAIGLELVTTYTTADGKQHVYSVEPFSVIKKEGDLYTFQVKHSLSNAGSFKVSYRMFPKNPELPHRQDFCYVRWFI